MDNNFVLESFFEACKKEEFHNRWMSAATWAEIVCLHYSLGAEVAFDGNKLVHAISRNKAVNSLIEGNDGMSKGEISVFRNKYRPKGMSKQVYCFYATQKGDKPKGVDATPQWHSNINSATDLLEKRITRSTTLTFESSNLKETLELKKLEESTLGKRKRPQTIISDSGVLKAANDSLLDPSSSKEVSSLARDLPLVSFWVSPEAIILFKPFGDETVLEALDNQIQLLSEVNKSHHGYTELIDNINDFSMSNASTYKIWHLCQKCTYLALALTLAKEHMNSWTWQKCCGEAVSLLSKCGINQTSNARTVMEWYRQFKTKRKFTLFIQKNKLPPFLEQNQDITATIKQYCKEHLSELSVEFLLDYLHKIVIPTMVKDIHGKGKDEMCEEEYAEVVRQVLKPYRLTCLSISTVSRWLNALGFKYEVRKKGYYVDGHEKPSTIEYRKRFCERYLGYEARMHRWIQVTEQVAKKLEEEGEITKGSGYYYYDASREESMVEFHVDVSDKLLLLGPINEDFGGNLSVRFPTGCKPLICFGHDESIYKQFLITKKTWIGPDGERNIVPKDDGLGVMVSAFQSREFGFGLVVSDEQLKEVNEKRKNTKYKDLKAAAEAGGSKDGLKKPLTCSPFVRTFEYGADSEGYWNYNHMVLQLEDCVDVLQYLYPQYDYIFLFDHSSGHDKQREDGLNVKKMTKNFGGTQRKMRDTVIKQEKGYLGTYLSKLKPGDTQSMVFKETDDGPFWMSTEQRENTRLDKEVQDKVKTRTLRKEELKKLLEEKGLPVRGTAKDLIKRAEENGISSKVTTAKIIEGWQGKPKGLLQVLWERGFIDETNLDRYTLNGRQDVFGVLIPETSLLYLMANCEDFEEEESLLQANGREMGVLVDRTPKCHCELAGEGIEYTWGCSKNYYRALNLQEKRGKDKFRRSVTRCLERDILTTERIRKFSRRARQYICAYYKIAHQDEATASEQEAQTATHLDASPIKVEKMVKLFKTHRCAMDFDTNFCKAVFTKREE